MADLRVKVGLDNSAFQTGLAAMENSVQRFGMKAGGLLAGAFTVDKILGGFMGAIDKGDQLQDLANRFGVAASAIQEIGNAASLSGAGIEDVASAMNKLARNAGEAIGGNEQMQESFEKIGLKVADLNGMSPQDLFMALSRAVASGALGMQDFAVAQELAGRGAASLMETLRMGPEAIAATGQAMGVFGDETTAALSKASDAIKTMQQQFTMAFGAIAAAAVPLIETFQTVVESVTLLGLATKSAITGDFGAAAQQLKAAQMVDVEKQMDKLRNAEAQTVRNVDGAGPGGSVAKEARAKEDLERAEERLAKAVRDRETRTLDSTQQIGRAELELLNLHAEAAALAENTADKFAKLEEIERKRIEIMDLQKDRQEDMLRLVEEETREREKLAEVRERVEDIRAERSGPKAEEQLLKKRAQEAIATAQETGRAGDILKAEEAARDFGEAVESRLRDDDSTKLFGIDPREEAKKAIETLGKIPNIPLPEPPGTDQGRNLRDTAEVGTVKVENGPQQETLQQINQKVTMAVDRLEALVRTSGTFGI